MPAEGEVMNHLSGCDVFSILLRKRIMINSRFRVVAMIVMSFLYGQLAAQQFSFISYGIKEGLPQSQVRCLLQDSKGYIWAGTLGGLARFDGRVFKNYDRQQGLFNNQINCLVEFSPGVVIAGSNGSFSVVSGTGVKSIHLPENFNESTINAMCVVENMLWIGTEDGLLQYDLDSGVFVSPGSDLAPLSDAHIKSILRTPSGLLILARETLFRYDQALMTIYNQSDTETVFFDVAQTSDGNIWIASGGEGLIRLNAAGNDAVNFLDTPELTTTVITGVTLDKKGALWLASRHGLYEYDGSMFNAYDEKNGLGIPDIRDVLCDREGNVWLATYGGGIQKFTGRGFSSYNIEDGLSSNAVMSITEDKVGDLWFSTFDKGICRMMKDSIVQFNLAELTDNNRIWTSLTDSSGDLWFGSSDGLFRYGDGKFELFDEKDSLSGTMVLSLLQSSDGVIWIGTQNGLTTYYDGDFSPVTETDAPKKKIRNIRQDRAGRLWFATIDGVYAYDGSRFERFTPQDGLSESSTNCIEVDEFNRIWVGTQNGISVMSGKHFTAMMVDKSSGSNVVNFLKYYGGRLWVGTNNGLYSAAAGEDFNTANMNFRHYGFDDGLRSMETNLNAVFLDSRGRFWFGTTEGVNLMALDELEKESAMVPPMLHLEKIQINLQDQNWSRDFKEIDSASGLPVLPELRYKQNHLTFYFTGISTTYPGNIVYQYMLIGLDEDWKAESQLNFVTYGNLPYKDYTFRVRARVAGGEWSQPLDYQFSITPPFWLRWWFIGIEIILALAIISIIVFNRRRAIKTKREKEWFEIRSRMLALEQQSLNSSMNRHFIFNALNSIQYYINRQDRLSANKYLSDFARLIRKNLDSSQDTLTSLRDETERLELYLKLEHMRFRDKFEYKIHIDPALNLDQIRVPSMLIQPFLENSIWHGLLPLESMGCVEITIRKSGESLEFVIRDNGIGIDNSLKRKTTADNHISKGMEITRNRIELIKKATGQTIELLGPQQIFEDNGQVGGTLVTILLPLNFREHFDQ